MAANIAPANDNRPAAFDAAIAAYTPGLRKLACRYTREADDLVQDTMVLAMKEWKNFREGGALWLWLTWQMKTAHSANRKLAKTKSRTADVVSIDDAPELSTVATQQDYSELSSTLSLLSRVRHGDVVLAKAMGKTHQEIANDRGVSKQCIWNYHAEGKANLAAAITRSRAVAA